MNKAIRTTLILHLIVGFAVLPMLGCSNVQFKKARADESKHVPKPDPEPDPNDLTIAPRT